MTPTVKTVGVFLFTGGYLPRHVLLIGLVGVLRTAARYGLVSFLGGVIAGRWF